MLWGLLFLSLIRNEPASIEKHKLQGELFNKQIKRLHVGLHNHKGIKHAACLNIPYI